MHLRNSRCFLRNIGHRNVQIPISDGSTNPTANIAHSHSNQRGWLK
jgi:hypothetical protein